MDILLDLFLLVSLYNIHILILALFRLLCLSLHILILLRLN